MRLIEMTGILTEVLESLHHKAFHCGSIREFNVVQQAGERLCLIFNNSDVITPRL